VEFSHTIGSNQRSRQAIARLGAKAGTEVAAKSSHWRQDGPTDDTVVFSILDSEWPVVAKFIALFSLAAAQ